MGNLDVGSDGVNRLTSGTFIGGEGHFWPLGELFFRDFSKSHREEINYIEILTG